MNAYSLWTFRCTLISRIYSLDRCVIRKRCEIQRGVGYGIIILFEERGQEIYSSRNENVYVCVRVYKVVSWYF